VVTVLNKKLIEGSDIINNYKYSLGMAYADFFEEYILKVHFMGRDEVCKEEYKLFLLNSYIEIMYDWLFIVDEEDENFFRIDAIKEIERKINEICGTNFSIFENLCPLLGIDACYEQYVDEAVLISPTLTITPST
jgi:hypothetical protein